MEDSATPGRDMGAASAGGALAAFLGAIIRRRPGSIAGAALAPYAVLPGQRAQTELGRRCAVVEAAALEVAGLTGPEEFCEILSDDPGLIDLAQKIAWAASISGSVRKLRGFGALLGGAVACRGDRLDETELLVAALAHIETPHAVVLDVLTGLAPDGDEGPDDSPDLFPWRAQNLSVAMPGRQAGWLTQQIAAEVPMASDVVARCLGVLTYHGLAVALPPRGGMQQFMITDLGRALSQAMRPRRPNSDK